MSIIISDARFVKNILRRKFWARTNRRRRKRNVRIKVIYYGIITRDCSGDAKKWAKKRETVLFPDKLAKKGLTYIANVAIILHVAARESAADNP